MNQSNCPCYQCEDNQYLLKTQGYKTNIGAVDGEIPLAYACYSNIPFDFYNIDQQHGYTVMNPQVLENHSIDLDKVTMPNIQGIDTIQYVSAYDSRLRSSLHSGQHTILDRPPQQCTIDGLTSTFNTDLDGYGKPVNTYSDINSGQIVYYVNNDQKNPFCYPNFSMPATVDKNMFKDPMGALKPQYNRNTSVASTHYPQKYIGNLSWIQDSQDQREDIMSLQMRRRNQQRWETLWE